MYKLLATYKTPSDIQAFEEHYHRNHLPLVRKIPGLVRIVLNRGIAPPWGGEPAFYLMAEMQFADEDTYQAAMSSRENREAGTDIRQFAGSLVTLATAKEE